MEKKAIARRSSQYFFVKIYATLMHVAGNFVIAKLFTVAGYGAFGFLALILTYGASLHLGLENGFGKQYPVEIGKGDKSRADKLRDSAFTFSMIITCVVMCLMILFSLFSTWMSYEKRWALVFLAFTLPLQMLMEYYRTFFRVTKEFGRINVMELIFSTLEFVLRVGPVYYFVYVSPKVENALIGLFTGLFLTFGVTVLFAYLAAPEKIKIRFDKPEIKYLYRLGFPIFICFLMDSFFKNGDKFMAKIFFGDEGMGYYLLGSQIAALLYLVPFAVGWVVFPVMLQRYGETNDGTKVTEFVFPPTSAIIQAIIPLSAMMYLSLDYLIPLLLSKYSLSIEATKILIPGMYFWCVVIMFMYFLIAMDDRVRMVMYQAAALALNLFLNWLFAVRMEMYISGIALGTTISYMVYSYFLLQYSITKYHGEWRNFSDYYMKVFLVQFAVFIAVILFDQYKSAFFWSDYFMSLAVFKFFSWIHWAQSTHRNLLLNGFGIYIIEMLIVLLFTGSLSLAIRKWKILGFRVTKGSNG
jgi:O-antigen/teichoic acid export membrane protein